MKRADVKAKYALTPLLSWTCLCPVLQGRDIWVILFYVLTVAQSSCPVGAANSPEHSLAVGHRAPPETSSGLPGHSPGLPGRAIALLKGLKRVHVSGSTSNKCEYKSTANPTDSCPVCQCDRVYTEVHDKFKCCSANEAGIWFQISCTLHLINYIFWEKKMNYC